MLLALKVEERPQVKEPRQPLKAGKVKITDSLLEPLEGTQPRRVTLAF